MRLSIENILAVTILMLAEAWFLQGVFAGKPSWDASIAFVGAIASFFAKDYVKDRLKMGQPARTHDRALFESFLADFPVHPTFNLLKGYDFGNSFWSSEMRPLFSFADTWGDVDKEFLDSAMEKKRKALLKAAQELSTEFAKRTVPVGNGEKSSVFPDRLRAEGPRPSFVLEDASVLNAKSRDFVPIYEDFVRSGMRKFLG
ncbi:hypothetical protein XarbCFBP7604_18295 [Xanthomonas arboricola]|uniref:hypothetical protein n=1 Tax=Xanthomonas arboricola TaxID=56448 RepID=UPI000CEE32CA|nr:hypothetical protein [Xanthomonas arboricola]PPU31357.1 hypothetical protein XarbCFBP7604_18295 [Xanthomonas arboricola]